MKKFQDQKNPLAMLKIKMQMKAQSSTEYKIFADELAGVTCEQDKFIEESEWLVAIAEASDAVQVIVFFDQRPPSLLRALGARLLVNML